MKRDLAGALGVRFCEKHPDVEMGFPLWNSIICIECWKDDWFSRRYPTEDKKVSLDHELRKQAKYERRQMAKVLWGGSKGKPMARRQRK